MDDNETVSPFGAQALPGSLQLKFTAAKARIEEAKVALAGVLCEMVKASQAKVIEDGGGEFPDITIVAHKRLLDLIESYDFQSSSALPSWLDEDGEEIFPKAPNLMEWF